MQANLIGQVDLAERAALVEYVDPGEQVALVEQVDLADEGHQAAPNDPASLVAG